MKLHEKELLEQIKISCISILKDNLIGIYIHGSLAFDCFNWDKSDIDFIIVTKSSPTLCEKKKLILALLKTDCNYPPKGLEMSLVLEEYCHHFIYPTPFELHFSNAHKEKCQSNLEDYCENMKGTDKDLAAHFTVIRKVGITLYGKDIPYVFDTVPKTDYIDSIKCDIENAITEIIFNPVYIILNLCRVLAFIRNDLVLSKAQGALWGLKNLPSGYTPVIKNAADSYSTNKSFSANISDTILSEFAGYMLEQIYGKKLS